MMIILDSGHGKDTPGKRSPVWPNGKQLLEYEFNRDIVARIASQLSVDNILFHILCPELEDISLQERCNRANWLHNANHGNSILVSVHANAGGGTGWECWTSRGNTESDYYATVFYDEFRKIFPSEKVRCDYSDGDPDKESDFYLLKNTVGPALITENFFMDNERDCKILLSEEGRKLIAQVHINAIKEILR